MEIRDFVDKENKVFFSYYRADMFYYCVRSLTDGQLYCFPVPREDIGGATLNYEDKAIIFMRWIRQAITDKTIQKEIG